MNVDIFSYLDIEEIEYYYKIYDKWVAYEDELIHIRYADLQKTHMENFLTEEEEIFTVKLKHKFYRLLCQFQKDNIFIIHQASYQIDPKIVNWLCSKDNVHYIKNPLPYCNDILMFKHKNDYHEYMYISGGWPVGQSAYEFLENIRGWKKINFRNNIEPDFFKMLTGYYIKNNYDYYFEKETDLVLFKLTLM